MPFLHYINNVKHKLSDNTKDYSKEFLDKTIKVWQPYSHTLLSLEDAEEIIDNMTGLFEFLIELDKKYGKEEKNI